MPRRAATVTQADVARTIRAVLAAGLTVKRVVARPDGVAVETTDTAGIDQEDKVEPTREFVL